MTDLREKQRKSMPKAVFAYVDDRGEGHLPVNDESHIRNAIARWNQTAFETKTDRERARRKILAAARRHGIEVSGDDKVARPSAARRGVRTARRARTTRSRRAA